MALLVGLQQLGWLPPTQARVDGLETRQDQHEDRYECDRAEFRWDQAHAQLRREEAEREPELDHIIELESRLKRAQEDIDKYC